MEYASRGLGATGAALGGSALGVALLNGGLGNILGGMGGNHACHENTPVNRYELNLTNELAAKDAKIGLLESNIYTDKKITDTYAVLNSQINELAAEVRANKDAQCAVNMNQAVLNGTTGAAINCIQNNIAQLYSLTALRIPNTSICPGWGNVTITPATTPTTTG